MEEKGGTCRSLTTVSADWLLESVAYLDGRWPGTRWQTRKAAADSIKMNICRTSAVKQSNGNSPSPLIRPALSSLTKLGKRWKIRISIAFFSGEETADRLMVHQRNTRHCPSCQSGNMLVTERAAPLIDSGSSLSSRGPLSLQ